MVGRDVTAIYFISYGVFSSWLAKDQVDLTWDKTVFSKKDVFWLS